jgi:hypothetical protein
MKLTKAAIWIAAGGTSVAPPASLYFTNYPPPFWPGLTLLTAGLSLGIVYRVGARRSRRSDPRVGFRLLIGSLLVLLAYAFALR